MKHLPGAACAARLSVDYARPTRWLSWGYKSLTMKSAARCPFFQPGLAPSGELGGFLLVAFFGPHFPFF